MVSERKNITCPNCQKSFDKEFKYCPECGQANKKLKLDVKYFFSEFLSGMFNLDSKIFRTLKLLFLKPGMLSKEFIAGRRNSYIPPVRLYLIGSLIYFTISALLNDPVKLKSDHSSITQDGIVITLDELDSLKSTNNESDTTLQNDNISDSLLIENMTLGKAQKLTTKEGRKQFNENIKKYLPIGMFIFVPLTAFLFFILFRRNSYYIEHLIFVIHLQTLFYLIFTIISVIELVFSGTVIELITAIMFISILLIWFKKYYCANWWTTIWKAIVFIIMYGLIFLIFFIAIASVSLIAL